MRCKVVTAISLMLFLALCLPVCASGAQKNEEPLPKSPYMWNILMDSSVWSLDISEDGHYIVVGTAMGFVYLFDTQANSTPLWTYQTENTVYATAISKDGSYIVAGGEEKIYFFTKESDQPLWNWSSPAGGFKALSISSDGSCFAGAVTTSSSGALHFFNSTLPYPLWTVSFETFVEDCAISSDGEVIAVGTHKGVYIFDRTGNLTLFLPTGSWVLDVAISSDGNYVVAGTGVGGDWQGFVYLIDTHNKTLLWKYTYHPGASWFWSVDISANGDYIIAGDGGAIGVYNATAILLHKSSPNPLWYYETAPLPFGEGPIYVSISEGGSAIAVACRSQLHFFQKDSSTPDWIYSSWGSQFVEFHVLDISTSRKYIVAGTWGGDYQYLYLFPYTLPMRNLTFYVYDATTNMPVSDAEIIVESTMKNASFNKTTNGAGCAIFKLEEDEYYIIVDATGYESYKSAVFVLNKDMEFDIFLMPLNPIQENNLTAWALVGIFIATTVVGRRLKGLQEN